MRRERRITQKLSSQIQKFESPINYMIILKKKLNSLLFDTSCI